MPGMAACPDCLKDRIMNISLEPYIIALSEWRWVAVGPVGDTYKVLPFS